MAARYGRVSTVVFRLCSHRCSTCGHLHENSGQTKVFVSTRYHNVWQNPCSSLILFQSGGGCHEIISPLQTNTGSTYNRHSNLQQFIGSSPTSHPLGKPQLLVARCPRRFLRRIIKMAQSCLVVIDSSFLDSSACCALYRYLHRLSIT